MRSLTKPTRSWLFTPGSRPDRFAKAAKVGADVVILDLEDAVSPDEKSEARATTIEYLSTSDPNTIPARPALTGSTPRPVLPISAICWRPAPCQTSIVLPKADSQGHLHILDRLLTANKLDTRLVGLIESARGLAAVEAIAAATPRLVGLMLGAADMAADLGITAGWPPLVPVRSRLVLACALAGVIPIDSPFFDVHDQDGLSREAADAVAFGFPAKAAIHPAQVGPINQALTPTAEAREHAKAVLAANTKGVGVVDGKMIDAAVARKAHRILAVVGQ